MRPLSASALVWLEMQRLGDRVETSLTAATIETGAVCNLRCPFCPTGNGDLRLDQTLLNVNTFKAMLDSLGPRLRRLFLYNWGEPLLNPRLYDLLEEARARHIFTLISTNFSLPPSIFSASHAERMIRSGLNHLTVSCDGASRERYRLYRVGGDFDRVLANIRTLLDAKRRLRSDRPRILWKFLLHKNNLADVPTAKKLAVELGIPILFRTLIVPAADQRTWTPPPERPPRSARRPRPPAAENPAEPRVPGQQCLQIWSTPVIHPDGTVLPCCVVKNREYALGNVREAPLRELWNRPLIVAMRRYLRTGRWSRRKLPCYGCPHDPHSPAPAAAETARAGRDVP